MLKKIVGAAAALSLLVSSLSWAEPTTVRIAYQTGDINVLLSYAQGAGLFEQHGLKAELVAFPAGPAILPALAGGKVDLAWMGEMPAVTGFSNGIPLEVLMMERLDDTNIRLAANPKAGITSLEQLKGKRVAASIGSSSHHHLLQALKSAGLTQNDISVVNLPPANMPPAYAAGQVDAAVTWEPAIGLIEEQGAKPLATTRSLGMVTGGYWIGHQSFSRQNPETLQAFLAVWDQAQRDYSKDIDGVRRYEAARIGQTSEQFNTLIARQSARHPTFEEQVHSDFFGPTGQRQNARLVKHFQAIGQFLLAQERIQALPTDWSLLFNTQPIETYLKAHKP
ncbi:taurine transport system substrate-binding protein [Pseudomonas frederiksbergensis]|uniref:taurine ABC transporter substrate-binding protein n=1 Tax=Pseudomonas frederiksbergensis TaxID=104087 RepID=UPI003D1F542E